jgi:hypothetical protein
MQRLKILGELFGEEARVDAVLLPTADPICDHEEVLLCDPGIFSSLLPLLVVGNIGRAISEVLFLAIGVSQKHKEDES